MKDTWNDMPPVAKWGIIGLATIIGFVAVRMIFGRSSSDEMEFSGHGKMPQPTVGD